MAPENAASAPRRRSGQSAPASANRQGRQEQGARTRERVLEVTTDLMARRGYSGTTISAICKAAGVMPASIYWHFESKEGLLAAVVERAADAWFEGALRAIDEAEASGDAEAPRFRGFHYAFQEQPEFFRLLLLIALERRGSDDPSVEAVRRIRERTRSFLAGRLEARVEVSDPELRQQICERLAGFGMVLLDGFFVAHQIDPASDEELERLFEQFVWAIHLARESFIAEGDER